MGLSVLRSVWCSPARPFVRPALRLGEGAATGVEGPRVLMAVAALRLPGHNELKVAISKVLTMGRWGGKRAALNET